MSEFTAFLPVTCGIWDALAGHVNIITKSGTNQWHGSLFENFQSNTLNARNQLLKSKAPLTFNEFGGSFGGPIRKNRIFVFGDYEGYREAAFAVVQGTVPTEQTRTALLTAVLAPLDAALATMI